MRRALLVITLLCFAGTASALIIPTSKRQSPRVHSTLDLTTDPKVNEIEPNFALAARSNVVFTHCRHYWEITPEQAEFQPIAFKRISNSYLQAFYDAYERRVGTPPSSSVINNYTKYVYAKEAKEMNVMIEAMNKISECGNGKVVRVLKFMEKLRQEDLEEQKKLGTSATAGTSSKTH